MGVSNIAFSGGEPLERSDLPLILAHAASCRTEHIETVNGVLKSDFAMPHLYLLSNGSRVDDSILRLCGLYGIQLSMSLPGLDTFACHTGVDGADRVLRAFTTARSVGLRTVANITVTKLNLHELDRVISAALLAGAEQVLLNRFLPGGRGLRFAERLALSGRDLVQMLDTAETSLEAAGRFGSLGTEVPRCLVDPSAYHQLHVSTRCSAAIQFFVVGPSGFVRVCNHSPINLNHVDDICGLKQNDYWRRFTRKHYLPAACGACAHRSSCDGGCREAAHVVGGAPDAPDILLMGHGRQDTAK
jgi:radical SAM protein with 4Fe4S-binding SPASM domain